MHTPQLLNNLLFNEMKSNTKIHDAANEKNYPPYTNSFKLLSILLGSWVKKKYSSGST